LPSDVCLLPLSPFHIFDITGVPVYRPGYKARSDADILRDAKLEAMGLPPKEESPRRSNHERNHMATDEIVRDQHSSLPVSLC
jgi:hypothetical protein